MTKAMRGAVWTAAAILVASGIGRGPHGLAVGAEVLSEQIDAPDGEGGDIFGLHIDLDFDTLVVGAQGEDNGSGAVYVFVESGGTWNFQQKLTSDVRSNDEAFGWSVDVHGDLLVVGAPDNTDNGNDAGAIYIFTRIDDTWTLTEKVYASNAGISDRFGQAVGVRGTTVVAVAPNEDTTIGNSGALYVIGPDGVGGYEEKQMVKAATPEPLAGFTSVEITDGYVAVASIRSDDAGTDTGSVHVFTEDLGVWSQTDLLRTDGDDETTRLGTFMSADADTVVAADATGKLLVWRDDGGWSLEAFLEPDQPDRFDSAPRVGVYGDTVVAGPTDTGGNALLFARANGTWSAAGQVPLPDPDINIADVDIYDDKLATGDNGFEGATVNSGAAWVQIPIIAAEPVAGAFIPKKVTFVADAGGGGAKKRTDPGVSASGTLDLGPNEVDLTLPAMLTVGGGMYDLPSGLTESSDGKKFTAELDLGGDESLFFEIKPDKKGKSSADFEIELDDALPIAVGGFLDLVFENDDVTAVGRVVMTDFEYKREKIRGTVVMPVASIKKLKTKIKTESQSDDPKDSVTVTFRFATDGTTPATAPDLKFQYGGFEQILPGGEFTLKKDKFTWKGDAPGVTKATIDYKKEQIKVTAKELFFDLEDDLDQNVSATVTISLDDDGRAVSVRAHQKNKNVKY